MVLHKKTTIKCIGFVLILCVYYCSHSSRCAHIPVWWQCSPLDCRRAWQCLCAGPGPQCPRGSQYPWVCSGCFRLLALFSTAWYDIFSIIYAHKCYNSWNDLQHWYNDLQHWYNECSDLSIGASFKNGCQISHNIILLADYACQMI